jgi:NAD(P)H dehydrogenase (quinone)
MQGRLFNWGYDGKTFEEIAQILTEILGQPFYAEDCSREDFLANALQAGADPAYMNCVYNQFKLNVEGKIPNAGATFGNFEAITGRKPMTWREFVIKHREELIA